MKQTRRRYVSPAKRRFRKRLLVVVIAAAVVVLALLLLLPTITGGRVTPLPFQRSRQSNPASAEKTPFRWPWQKEPSATPSITPAPTPLAGAISPTAEDGMLPGALTASSPVTVLSTPYPIQLDVNITERGRMQVVEQITYTNTTSDTQMELLLHFPAASLVDGGLSRLAYDGLTNTQAYHLDAPSSLLTLPLNEGLLPGQTLRVTFAYVLNVPEGTSALSFQSEDNTIIAADFYATLATYDPAQSQWLADQHRGLPLTDITANITMPAGYALANSGAQVSRNTLSTGNIRVLVEDMSSRGFAFATGDDGMRNETITVADSEFTVTNHAARSSTVVRVSELSSAILGHYSRYMGWPAADGNGINVLETLIAQPTATYNNLVLYNENSYDDVNEFRYQYALALARIYLPEGAAADQSAEAFNTLLCNTLASLYVEGSQSADIAAAAYAHVPESSALSQIIQNMPEGALAQALQQYLVDGSTGGFQLQAFYSALPSSSVPAVESLLLEYRQRTES